MGLGRLLNICRSLEEESEVKRRSHEEKCLEITCCNLITNSLETSRSYSGNLQNLPNGHVFKLCVFGNQRCRCIISPSL